MRIACFVLALAGTVHAQSAAPPVTAGAVECAEFAAKVDSCSPYTCTFTHPITGAPLERKIVGLTSTNCTTVESMPGKHTMQCTYPADMRHAVANFFRTMKTADTAGQAIAGTAAVDDTGKRTATTTINGKAVENPLQSALDRGMCKVSDKQTRILV